MADNFIYDVNKLKIFDRKESEYMKERSDTTALAESIAPMFRNRNFNNNTFNKVFDKLKHDAPQEKIAEPSALPSSSMPTYGSAIDCGNSIVTNQHVGPATLTRAFGHTNPVDYSESFIERCSSTPIVSKDKPLDSNEYKTRINAYHGITRELKNNTKTQQSKARPFEEDEEPPMQPIYHPRQPMQQPIYHPQQQIQQPMQQPIYHPHQQQMQQPMQQPIYHPQQPIYHPPQQMQQPMPQPIYHPQQQMQQPIYHPQQQPMQQPIYQPPQQPIYPQTRRQRHDEHEEDEEQNTDRRAHRPAPGPDEYSFYSKMTFPVSTLRHQQPPIHKKSDLRQRHNPQNEIEELRKIIKKQNKQIQKLIR